VEQYRIRADRDHTYWRHTLEAGNAAYYAQDPAFAKVLGSCRFEVVLCLPQMHDGHMSLGGSFLILYAIDDPTNVFVCAEK